MKNWEKRKKNPTNVVYGKIFIHWVFFLARQVTAYNMYYYIETCGWTLSLLLALKKKKKTTETALFNFSRCYFMCWKERTMDFSRVNAIYCMALQWWKIFFFFFTILDLFFLCRKILVGKFWRSAVWYRKEKKYNAIAI